MKNFLKVLRISIIITIIISILNIFVFGDGDYTLEGIVETIIICFIFSFQGFLYLAPVAGFGKLLDPSP